MAAQLNERDTKLVQWLLEAHAKEAELETSLEAHIGLTEKMSYKKRLRSHLTETRDHGRRLERRIKQLGGSPPTSGLRPTAVVEAAGKTLAAVKGQVGAVRAALTDQAETHLRNAQEELREEHVEIALYTRIEAFADAVGDTETVKLAASIRRDEERMAKFLEAEVPKLVRDLVRAEVPASQRRTSTARRRPTARRAGASTSRSRARTAA